MNKYESIILNYLLDKYERSVISKQGTSLKLKIKVKVIKLFNKYDSSGYYQERLAIDKACNYLNQLHLISYTGDEDDIDEVILNLDHESIEHCYKLLSRVSPKSNQQVALNCLNEILVDIDWINRFKDEMINKLRDYKSISRYLPLDVIEIKEIFAVLLALTKQQEEISFRKFSIKALKDSKRLEEIKGKIINIITDYFDIYFQDEDELFGYFNVIKNPGFIYLNGNIKIKLNEQIIDIGKLKSPFSLTTKNIRLLEILEIRDSKILTIENLTSFYDTSLDDTLVIYLGGYHNTLRRELLLKIYAYNQQLKFYHFGDIDAGGFYIYRHLIEKTNIPFEMIRMDKQTLIKYQKYTKPLTINDRKRLDNLKMLIDDDVIDYMLEHNCKLEQEIVELERI